MKSARTLNLAALALLALVGLGPGTALAEDIQAILVGTDKQPDASGIATYKPGENAGPSGAMKGGKGLEVAVVDIDITDTVYVLINGDFVAQISIVGTKGSCSLETDKGDVIPDIQSGDVIEIVDEDGNDLLVGVF
jgi:hypothetical protein